MKWWRRAGIAGSSLLFALTLCSGANATTINWVEYPSWNPMDTVGVGSSAELDVDVTFTLNSGTFDGRPLFRPESAVIDDPSWRFDNNVVPALSALGVMSENIDYTLSFSYANVGGLPAGGSVVVIDLEDIGSNVTLSGLIGGLPVAVDWTVSFLEVSGLDADFPSWDAATSTLTGTTVVAGSTRNLVFLVTDRQLDEVQFHVTGPRDGIDFNTAAQTVVIPEPSVLALLGLGLTGLGFARRRLR